MSAALGAGLIQILIVLSALALAHRPLGEYMARVFTTSRHLRVERLIYRIVRIDPDHEQRWQVYLRSLLSFSLLSVLMLYLLQRTQQLLPLSVDMPAVPAPLAWNTAVSFTTNTNWQAYSGERTLGYLTQMAGLGVQNFVSAGVGLAVAIAFIRGLSRRRMKTIGSFWVDLTRSIIRILLPLSFIAAIILLLGGVIQNFLSPLTVQALDGSSFTIPGGPVASQEAIKELGTNGGGFFNANSAHPFENPTAWTNLFEIFLLLLIPSCLPRTFGVMVDDTRQGWAVLGAMSALALISLTTIIASELANSDSAIQQAGLALEGRETRFGVIPSAFFAASTTVTSTGAVDSFHSSYSSFGGGMLVLNMLLGEIAPGGVGSGLYGMLMVALLTVFIAGLMVGRTPEYLGKRIGPTEIKLICLYMLVVPVVVLLGTGLSITLPTVRESMLSSGPHGLTELLYAFASTGNNNGSAFAGLSADTPYLNTALGLAMLLGRFLPMIFVLALAGRLAEQSATPPSSGTLPTHRPLFVGVMVCTVLVVTGLTFLPALALGPLAEGLS